MSYILPLESSIFNTFDTEGLQLPTRLRLSFSHLNKHRFPYNFQESLNPLCASRLEAENTTHYLLHCHHNTPFHIDLTKRLLLTLSSYQTKKKVEILLYGNSWYNDNKSNFILSASINYSKKTKRFDCSLFD